MTANQCCGTCKWGRYCIRVDQPAELVCFASWDWHAVKEAERCDQWEQRNSGKSSVE